MYIPGTLYLTNGLQLSVCPKAAATTNPIVFLHLSPSRVLKLPEWSLELRW